MKRRMLFISGVDLGSPFAGEEEYLIHEWLKKAAERFEVVVLSIAFPGAKSAEIIDGITYLRIGDKRVSRGEFDWRAIWEVFKYYWKQIRGRQKFDLVIERWDKGPFLFGLYGDRKTILMINRLWKERWGRVLPWYLAWVFRLVLEPVGLWLLRKRRVMTTERGVKKELVNLGFEEHLVEILRKGLVFKPVESLERLRKYKTFTLISSGVVEPSRRIEEQLKIFEKVREEIPEARWIILGSRRREYWERISTLINRSGGKEAINYSGLVERWRMMRMIRRSQVRLSMTDSMEKNNAYGQGTVVVDGGRDVGDVVEKIVKLYRDRKWYGMCQEKQYRVANKMRLDKSTDVFGVLLEKWSRNIENRSVRVGVLGFSS
jgi:glycosyltransferase involved in cell wall biosynthesis